MHGIMKNTYVTMELCIILNKCIIPSINSNVTQWNYEFLNGIMHLNWNYAFYNGIMHFTNKCNGIMHYAYWNYAFAQNKMWHYEKKK